MNKLTILSLGIATVASTLFLGSCDKVEFPYPEAINTDLDTTFYPGNFQYYMDSVKPVFEENTNTQRNAIIEDYTGHRCANCPNAAEEAHTIYETNPSRIFTAAIHTSPGPAITGDFQTALTSGNKYLTNHRCAAGDAYGIEFQNGFGFFGNPSGNVNRTPNDNTMFINFNSWSTRVQDVLSDANLKVNIQSEFNYYEQNGGGYLHAEAELLDANAAQYNMVVYVIQDSLVDWQLMPDNSDNGNYVHRDLLLGTVDGAPWGQAVFPVGSAVGTKTEMDYSFGIPTGYNAENLHFLLYVYDTDTYEILQVIKQKLVH